MRWYVFLASCLFLVTIGSSFAEQKPHCSKKKRAEIFNLKTGKKKEAFLNCSLNFEKRKRITKQLILQGDQGSKVQINCQGGAIGRPGGNRKMLVIRSSYSKKHNTWLRPNNITIKNCKIYGGVHIYGSAPNGEGPLLRTSSRSEGHSQRTKSKAPYDIHFSNIEITTKGRIPLYLAPGVTKVTLENSKILGRSESVAMYLDAESAENVIKNNLISVETSKREQIAVDGSARNVIVGNRFTRLNHGGIYLYRNCGEGGNIRHQAPNNNLIANNFFFYEKYHGSNPAVHLASRTGFLSTLGTILNVGFCHEDDGFDIGSSADDRDFAENNRVVFNQFREHSPSDFIKDSSSRPNTIKENFTVSERDRSRLACLDIEERKVYPPETKRRIKGRIKVCRNGMFQ